MYVVPVFRAAIPAMVMLSALYCTSSVLYGTVVSYNDMLVSSLQLSAK